MDIVAPTSVYLYRDRHDILIYVGITSRGIKRNREHNETKDWWQFVASQEVEHFDTRPSALARERDLIEKHRPPFNKQHNLDHRKVREAYLLFAAAQSQSSTLLDEIRSTSGQIPLDVHGGLGELQLVLRTRISTPLIGAALEMPDGEFPKVHGLQRKKKGPARLVRIDKAGPLSLLFITQKVEHPIKQALLSVNYRSKDRSITAKGVQVTLDHSDTSLCNQRCPRPPRTQWIRPDGQGAA